MKQLYLHRERRGEHRGHILYRLSGLAGLGTCALLWVALWGSINSGPWRIVGEKAGMVDWVNAIRASMPLVVLLLWILSVPTHKDRSRTPTGTEALWILYALLMLGSTYQTDNWFLNGYWAICYLSVLGAIDISLRTTSVARAIDMVRFNWLLATLFLVAMLILARDVLFVEGETGLTAYHVDQRAQAIAGASISKTSGLARLAIVPAVVGLVLVFQDAGRARLLWAALFAGASTMIWFFQTRQGIFGMAFCFGFVLLLHGGRARAAGVALSLFAGLFLLTGAVPDDVVTYVTDFAMRGEGAEAFRSMTGRDVLWRKGWKLVEESPWLGYGPQADRRLLGQNASNGPLYAAMCAGYPGMLLYLGGLIGSWVLFARVLALREVCTSEERTFLVQVGGIMAYLTLRNIPENTTSFYSVDLLLYAPMVASLGILERELGRRHLIKGAIRRALEGKVRDS